MSEQDKGYIIYYWMNSFLKGLDLLVFAVIYAFNSTEKNQSYYGSQDWLSTQLHYSRQSISETLKRLQEKEYIIKLNNGYKPNYEVIDKMKCKETLQNEMSGKVTLNVRKPDIDVKKVDIECKESLHNNIYNNIEDNIEDNNNSKECKVSEDTLPWEVDTSIKEGNGGVYDKADKPVEEKVTPLFENCFIRMGRSYIQ